MRKLTSVILLLAVCVAWAQNNDKITIFGRVKSALTKADLKDSYVLLYDSAGNVADSVRANKGYEYRAGQIDTTSVFGIGLPRVEGTYILDIKCDGYKTQTIAYELQNIGKRETYRNMDVVFLERAPVKLGEVTVTASKIKFYNKGDTVVYNADAFQLAEGSMLDALIAQLPGAELNNNGQIKVNGEFVESLLLNGREFFDGNNNLMLENIAAYTVKDIKVYSAAKEKDVLMGQPEQKVLTMNVSLKKEYNNGWIANLQGGYGTDNRYLGRAFLSWFNSAWNVSLVGNVNNLNDNRKPGRTDTWTPDMLPSGRKQYRNVGLNYSYRQPEGKKRMEGYVNYAQTLNDVSRTTSRINFLPQSDTYDYSYADTRDNETRLATSHFMNFNVANTNLGVNIDGNYDYTKNSNSELSGAFNEEPEEMTRKLLETIYSAGTPELLETVINRANTRTDTKTRSWTVGLSPYFSRKLSGSNDNINGDLGFAYSSSRQDVWKDYTINYGADAEAAQRLRQYFDNSPVHTLNLYAGIGYHTTIDKVMMGVSYHYDFEDNVKDSYMYALDRLADMGVYGTLPVDYLSTFDPANSFVSRTLTNKHLLNPWMRYYGNAGKDGRLILSLMPRVQISHSHLNYTRNMIDYRLSKTFATVTVSGIWNGMIEYQFNFKGEGPQRKYRNSMRLSYSLDPKTPDLVDMLDIVDDTDPLNIYLGNPDLRVQNRHRLLYRWAYAPHSHTFANYFYASYTSTSNELVRGYTYDTSTGVRINRMYNVDGNRTYAVTNELNWQFGAKKQFTLDSNTDIIFARYVDMIGVNLQAPAPTAVRNRSFTENLKLSWQLGSQTLSLRADYINRHTYSSSDGFNNLNANHVNAGVSGVFVLPAGFGISTDFTCYMRRGYGMANLDTTDAVWNMRLSYAPPRNKHWVFMVDGFDMLRQLSNVNYAVTATGRTVSYTNTLPRYILFSVQYRLNIQPKK